ncbi:hypothetical protein BC833DRAFT_602652 [Globomyces pollinis-pini]|nr:hypothetical protein BC833DRAFT_602652 [Globomyces pollinis-pini]
MLHPTTSEQNLNNIETRKILIPVDGSEISYNTLSWAIKNVIHPETDEILLVNVREHPSTGLPPMLPGSIDMIVGDTSSTTLYYEIDQRLQQASKEILEESARVFKSHKIHTKTTTLVGEPRYELEQFAKKEQPSMIVMANRGMGFVAGAFWGSVSEHLLHHAGIPVTIIPKA